MVAALFILILVGWGLVALFRKSRDLNSEHSRKRKYEASRAKQAEDRASLGWQVEKAIHPLLESIDSKTQPYWLEAFREAAEVKKLYLDSIEVRRLGKLVYAVYNYGRGEWYIEKLFLESKPKYHNLRHWCSSWKSRGWISQKFTSKKKALDALAAGGVWFDNNLASLEQVKAASGTGELLNVRYWGGSKPGKSRYLSVLDVYEFDYGEEENGITWYAEVQPRGGRKTKTYRVDRMEILPIDHAELIEDT